MTEPHPVAPTVFVSSVVSEFADLRSAIHFTLSERGVHAQVSETEDFSVGGDSSAVAECFRNIRESDCFVLLVGDQPGHVDESGHSITRQEFEVARQAFTDTGRPRMLMFVRRETIERFELGSSPPSAGDDHQQAFVGEIQDAANEPGFLKRFRSADEVLSSLVRALNLGRNFTESLTIHSLAYELADNLTRMGTRHHGTMWLDHTMLRRLEEDRPLTVDDLDRQLVFEGRQRTWLLMGLFSMSTGHILRTAALDNAIESSVFLEFDPAAGEVRASSLHILLRQLREDIDSFHSTQRREEVTQAFLSTARAPEQPVALSGHDVAFAYQLAAIAEDVCNGPTAAYRALTDGTRVPGEFQRNPQTPLGFEENRRLAAERLTVEQVGRLVQNRIHPFGDRWLRSTFGQSRDEQVDELLGSMGLPVELAAREATRAVVSELIEQLFASEAEGAGDGSPEEARHASDDQLGEFGTS